MHKNVLFGFLVAICCVFFVGCKEENKLVLATAAEFPPFEFKDGTEFKGIDIEITQEIAKILGKELEIKDMEFDSVIGAVSSGNVDFAASGLTINAKRAEVVDFSTSYFNANQVVVALKSNTKLKEASVNAQSLIEAIKTQEGIKIGVQTGATGAYYAKGDKDWGFSGIPNADVKSFVNGSLAVSALVNGQVDIVILDEEPARLISKAHPTTEVLNVALTEEKYGIAVKKGNKELLDSINSALKTLEANGTLKAILEKYYQ